MPCKPCITGLAIAVAIKKLQLQCETKTNPTNYPHTNTQNGGNSN